MKRSRLLLMLLWLPALAYGQEKYTLEYNPPVGGKWQEKLSAELTDVQVQGQPAGVTGGAGADCAVEVTAADADAKTVTAQVTLSNLAATLNGTPCQPGPADPMNVVVDRQGKMQLPDAKHMALLDFIATGGVPIQLIAVLAHQVRLPAQAVAVDEEWGYEDVISPPGMADTPINTRWMLKEVKDDVATIAATAAAVLPDFKIPNPMAPGTQMDVRAAKVNITEMTQQYRMKDSRLLSTDAVLQLDAMLDVGGMQVPAVLVMKFKLEPAEQAGQ